MNRSVVFVLILTMAPGIALAATPGSSESTAMQLREAAMADHSIAYSWLSELTTRIGPRPAGSENDHRAADWAAEKFKALGFEDVAVETFPLTAWVRGQERGELVSSGSQPLTVTALGESPATPPEGLEGEVVVFPTFEDLIAAPKGSLVGKIAMVTRRTVRTQDTSGYAAVAAARLRGPREAAQRGAVAFLIRSVGTDNHRMAHTGTTGYVDGRPGIPSFALSAPDADQIERFAQLGQTVRVKLFSSASFVSDAHSQNVVADVRGREHPEEVVLLGAHLDSWDLGTGAVDDGAGAAIMTAVAKLIHDLPQRPRRTVRVVLFGAEEVAQPKEPFFLFGGNAYAKKHAAELHNHVLAGESDLGADRIYAARLPASVRSDSEFARAAFRVLEPLGVLPTVQTSETGVDINPAVEAAGVPTFALYNDVSRYFDLHHTADDTFDKIDRQQLNQDVASWAVLTWLAADSDANFRAPLGAEKKDPTSLSALLGEKGKPKK